MAMPPSAGRLMTKGDDVNTAQGRRGALVVTLLTNLTKARQYDGCATAFPGKAS